MPPLLLVSQYQLTSRTSLGLRNSAHSKDAIFFSVPDLFSFVLAYSCKVVLCHFFISDILPENSKLVVLLIGPSLSGPGCAEACWCLYCALALAANTCPSKLPSTLPQRLQPEPRQRQHHEVAGMNTPKIPLHLSRPKMLCFESPKYVYFGDFSMTQLLTFA